MDIIPLILLTLMIIYVFIRCVIQDRRRKELDRQKALERAYQRHSKPMSLGGEGVNIFR